MKRLTPPQKKVFEKLKAGWKIETEGTGADLVFERQRIKLHYPTFQMFLKNETIELCGHEYRGLVYEVYELKKD